MGLFNKIINMLSDEVEEDLQTEEVKVLKDKERRVHEKEEPVAAEAPKEEVVAPKEEVKQVVKETTEQNERGLYQSADTFKFPVFGAEEIEQTLTRSKATTYDRPTERVERIERIERRLEQSQPQPRREIMPTRIEEKKDDKKSFRPSPVISPIYGVLDKNYSKEDVIDRTEEIRKSISREELSYDTVRRKAYGTLEDELEDTLMNLNKRNMDAVDQLEEEIKNLENPKKHIEQLLDELEKTASLTVGDIEEAIKNDLSDPDDNDDIYAMDELEAMISGKAKSNIEEELEDTNEIETKVNDEDLENDLFNLIDSMYDEGDDK